MIFGRTKIIWWKNHQKNRPTKKIWEISEISKMSTKLMSKMLTLSEFSKISEKNPLFIFWVVFSSFLHELPPPIFLWSLIHPCSDWGKSLCVIYHHQFFCGASYIHACSADFGYFDHRNGLRTKSRSHFLEQNRSFFSFITFM